ncbi:unnamed protein product [Psylliodes chrysocephalus]|uniref:Uncharacterized protein n=1 Tax=Psylliodes chrysocephalus TaxID=3402493 RepID=A0A9P0GIF9_9CUCU|nr:unnamed protein product [Psylliodes chrysocephala]
MRKKNHFKYGDLILIPELQKSAGYHLKCYRNLVAVKKSVVDEFNKSSQRENTNNEKFTNAQPNISSNSTDFVTDSTGSSELLPLSLSDEYVDSRIRECDIPEVLYDIVSALVEGPDVRRQKTNYDDVRIKSLCEDIIFIVTKRRIKPPKQLKLGLTIKLLTNSRILTILNKLGYTIAYTTAEELETELTFTSHETSKYSDEKIFSYDSVVKYASKIKKNSKID